MATTEVSAIDQIQQHAARIKEGRDPVVSPGRPERFTEAAQAGDTIAQGDLYLMIVDAVPAGYEQVQRPRAADKQLVPGTTQGARHCLASLAGVTLYRPPRWGQEESLAGPCFVTRREVTVLHPTHGDVTVPAGMTVLCGYQPEYDAQQRRERRNAD